MCLCVGLGFGVSMGAGGGEGKGREGVVDRTLGGDGRLGVWNDDGWADADVVCEMQRQTVISQFYQLDRLVVEGGASVCFSLSSF